MGAVGDAVHDGGGDHKLSRVVARYGRYDLLAIDELGYVRLDQHSAELLFQILTEREERAAIAVASNAPFSEWSKTFTDPRLVTAASSTTTTSAEHDAIVKQHDAGSDEPDGEYEPDHAEGAEHN